MRICCVFFILLAAPSLSVARADWKLIWSDEFNGPANAPPDGTKWAYDLGNNRGWGNAELENYTSAPANAHLDGAGNLVIRVLKMPDGGYTSARLKTQGKFTVTYGKIEARIKIPYGQGIWPAFWMLGSDIVTASWPACGEIDIMENIGREPSAIHGTLHGPGYAGGNGITASSALAGGGEKHFADNFHVFSIVWTPQRVEFFVDSVSYNKVIPASLPAGKQWVFDKPFFLLFNVAVGGNWPGPPDASTVFPQEMTIDYVRVYQMAEAPENKAVTDERGGAIGIQPVEPGSPVWPQRGMLMPRLRQSSSSDRRDLSCSIKCFVAF
jgi:beta-glucanase (GH16 family)